MELVEAVNILEAHNRWRRDNSEEPITKMTNPTELGIAIDTIVKYFKTEQMRTREGIEDTIVGMLSSKYPLCCYEDRLKIREVTNEILDYLLGEENLIIPHDDSKSKLLFQFIDYMKENDSKINDDTLPYMFLINNSKIRMKQDYEKEYIAHKLAGSGLDASDLLLEHNLFVLYDEKYVRIKDIKLTKDRNGGFLMMFLDNDDETELRFVDWSKNLYYRTNKQQNETK